MTTSASGARYEIIKTYPQRGPLQQYRLAATTAFECFRCGAAKKSKLVTVLRSDWGHLLCNGCYGRLLSLHEIGAGSADVDAKSAAMAEQLLALASVEQRRVAEQRLRIREQRADLLDERSLRLLATAEFVASKLSNATELDWSAAVIGQCKAVEVEVISRLVEPLATACEGLDLTPDVGDKDFGRVARFCTGRSDKPPELGAVRHFLQTAANSVARQATSPLLAALRELTRPWPRGDWLLAGNGLPAGIDTLTTSFRNRAAHTEELRAEDYTRCDALVAGSDGLIRHLISATSTRP